VIAQVNGAYFLNLLSLFSRARSDFFIKSNQNCDNERETLAIMTITNESVIINSIMPLVVICVVDETRRSACGMTNVFFVAVFGATRVVVQCPKLQTRRRERKEKNEREGERGSITFTHMFREECVYFVFSGSLCD
jgi:hypothetical protein